VGLRLLGLVLVLGMVLLAREQQTDLKQKDEKKPADYSPKLYLGR
jgi:hypothetical protein